MYISRWKILAGMLTVSLGGLATVAGQCPKPDSSKNGKSPVEAPISVDVHALPPLPASPMPKMPPAVPSLPVPEVGTQAAPLPPSGPTLPPVPAVITQAPGVAGGLPALPDPQPVVVPPLQAPTSSTKKPESNQFPGVSLASGLAIPQTPLPSPAVEAQTSSKAPQLPPTTNVTSLRDTFQLVPSRW